MGGERRATCGGPLDGAAVSTSIVDDPKHWRKRAEEIRSLADEMRDEISKQMMLQIAADCERLAKRAEERAKLQPQLKQPTTGAAFGSPHIQPQFARKAALFRNT